MIYRCTRRAPVRRPKADKAAPPSGTKAPAGEKKAGKARASRARTGSAKQEAPQKAEAPSGDKRAEKAAGRKTARRKSTP